MRKDSNMNSNAFKPSFDNYHSIAVIGAAGKMGSGIALLLLQEMGRRIISDKDGSSLYSLYFIDTKSQFLNGLKEYLQTHLLKWAEKNILFLRSAVEDNLILVSNREVIDYFLQTTMDRVSFTTIIEEAAKADLIFEAIVEDVNRKSTLYTLLKKICSDSTYYFSNTSSIPISLLSQQASLGNKIIGFHLYNPPSVQKLIEIIPMENGDPILTQLATEIAHHLGKQVIFSKDKAGFIGNGHFLRDIHLACSLTRELSEEHGLLQSIYIVNKMTQEFLLRPMGMFQLIDYVGLDIVANVGVIMNHYLEAVVYDNSLLEPLLAAGHIGGQLSDGSQKPGFFRYENHRMVAMLDFKSREYVLLSSLEWKNQCDDWLGSPPEGYTWKELSKQKNSENKVHEYLEILKRQETHGAKLALNFLHGSAQTAHQLVRDGIASSIEDVDTVLKLGFYHLYGVGEIAFSERI